MKLPTPFSAWTLAIYPKYVPDFASNMLGTFIHALTRDFLSSNLVAYM